MQLINANKPHGYRPGCKAKLRLGSNQPSSSSQMNHAITNQVSESIPEWTNGNVGEFM